MRIDTQGWVAPLNTVPDQCSIPAQVWLALEYKQIPYASMLIDLGNKPDWYQKIAPSKQVPAARINGKVVYESMDILQVTLPHAQSHSTQSQSMIAHLPSLVPFRLSGVMYADLASMLSGSCNQQLSPAIAMPPTVRHGSHAVVSAVHHVTRCGRIRVCADIMTCTRCCLQLADHINSI